MFVRDQLDISLVYIVVAKVTIFVRFDLLDHNILRDKFLLSSKIVTILFLLSRIIKSISK